MMSVIGSASSGAAASQHASGQPVPLPPPAEDGPVSVEQTLRRRRSIRSFERGELSIAELSQLLWAAQGVTSREGLRTSPSAGALYPMELYAALGQVTDLPSGSYKYRVGEHQLVPVAAGDRRDALAEAALGQSWIATAAAILVLCAVYDRTTAKYGDRGRRYVHIEAGHIAENVALQAVALGLGLTTVGAFNDAQVKSVASVDGGEDPLYLLPIGRV